MSAILYRFARFGDEGIAGHLIASTFRCCTLELPWRENRRDVSSIPAGKYDLVSAPAKSTFYLESDGISVHDKPGVARWGIRFDRANWAHELLGCIAVGRGLGFLNGMVAVQDSQVAREKLVDTLNRQYITSLIIEERWGGWE